MNSLSDQDLIKSYLTACAQHIQWLIDQLTVENDQLIMNGWALATEGEPHNVRFLINGKLFEKINYPIPSAGLGKMFWNLAVAQQARFVCQTTIDSATFNEGFACLEFLQNGHTQLARQTAWYFPNPSNELPIPEDPRILRVIGTAHAPSYLIGGAAIFKRLEYYLKQQFSRHFSDFQRILDWGCGSGRLLRHFRWVPHSEIWGVDIDADNIAWCQTHLPHAICSKIALTPPTSLPNHYFDLIIGISVFTHLTEANQFLWLQELQRISTIGAILILSVEGLSQMGLYQPPPALLREIEQKGFVLKGKNNDLDEVLSDKDYYMNTVQSRHYIYQQWGKYFTIIDMVDAIAANQDIIVMRHDPSL